MWQKKQILITVKAYPQESKRYVESVCTAGIDLSTGSWIRLYPVPFRLLTDDQQFKKYQIIEVECLKATEDSRPESYKIRGDSIRVLKTLGTKNLWEERRNIVIPTASTSMCEILAKSQNDGRSLGCFKPGILKRFYWESAKNDEDSVQLGIFDLQNNRLEPIPYDFRYEYFCADNPTCTGHTQIILDWEIGEAFRKWRKLYGSDEETLKAIRNRWQNDMFSDKKDTFLFVGNHHRFRQSFMVLGVFWPPRDDSPKQLKLLG